MDDKEPFIKRGNDRSNSVSRSTSRDNMYGENVPLSHPNHIVQRLLALLLMCILGFGSYFCYDNPGALQDNFISDMSLNTSEFVLLYSWYSWPNIICCFIGGFLLDRVFGIRFGTCLYCLLVFIGQLVFAAGAYTNSLLLAVVGRFIFGLGGESLAVAQNNYAVIWFKGKELNMVFGFQLSFARAGSTVNFVFMGPIYKYISKFYHGYRCLGIALFVASGSCLLSLLSATILGWQDKRAERLSNRRTAKPEEVVRLSDVKRFPLSFWLTTFIILFYYVSIFCFVSLGKVFFERKFSMDPDKASLITSLMYAVSAFLCPFLGFIIDKMGRNVFWVFISLLSTLIGHMLLAFTFYNPFIGMSFMAFGYSMMGSALWPLIALVVPEYQLGTAYGAAQSLQNGGQAVFTLFSGYIVDMYGYLLLETFFIACLCMALLLIIILWLYDANTTCLLNMSSIQRHAYELNKRVAEALEKEKLIASTSVCDVSSDDLLEPVTFGPTIRNRYGKVRLNYNENQGTTKRLPQFRTRFNENDNTGGGGAATTAVKRPQFGTRFLTDSNDVFKQNAWDNVTWDAEQEEQALRITNDQSKEIIPSEEFQEIEENAHKHWDNFYIIHKDGFYKDRHWLFTEFPELSTKHYYSIVASTNNAAKPAIGGTRSSAESSSTSTSTAIRRTILEIGCGVGNSVYPILRADGDPNLTVYCCDFSEEAIKMLKKNSDSRCVPFLCDVTKDNWNAPFEAGSLEIILMVYVLSSINPDKMRHVLKKTYEYLKPGGLLLFRDYGRYDLAQLRFGAGHCVSDNFYVRGEKTLVYFFTKEEITEMFTDCGYQEVQNICDKRLQVNRKKQSKMYRVWIQAKFRKPVR